MLRMAQGGKPLSELWKETVFTKAEKLEHEIAQLKNKKRLLLQKQNCRCVSLAECEEILGDW